MTNIVRSSTAEKLAGNIVSSCNQQDIMSYHNQFIDEILGEETRRHHLSVLLIAAYDAGLKINVEIRPTGEVFFCPFSREYKPYRVSGNLLHQLETYHNLQLHRSEHCEAA